MLQSIALSTTEAEYMILTKAAKKAIWLKSLVNEMSLKKCLVKVQCDNQSAMSCEESGLSYKNKIHRSTLLPDSRLAQLGRN